MGRIHRVVLLLLFMVVAAAAFRPLAHAQTFTTNTKLTRPPQVVSWTNGDVRLNGVVVVPDTPGRHPAVVLVSGAGKTTHDEPPFMATANVFLAHGFAVLLYDKRGSGASTGNLSVADFDDLAGDVNAGVRMLRERDDVEAEHIGCLGQSNGGWVCPLAARNDPRMAFVIMSSGAPMPPIEQNLYWIAGRVHAHGGSDAQAAAAQSARRRLWEYYRDISNGTVRSEDSAVLRESIGADLVAAAKSFPEMGTKVLTPDAEGMPLIRASARQQFYDAMGTLRALHVPLLAVFGADDDTVDPRASVIALDGLRKEGHRVETHVFPGQGHTLVTKVMGLIPRFAPGYLDSVTSWAAEVVGVRPIKF